MKTQVANDFNDKYMRKEVLMSILVLSGALCLVYSKGVQDNIWHAADLKTLRLPPAAFPQLPKNIMRNLQARRCSVPQAFSASVPHNVVRGEFARRGQTDWAVLCSNNRASSILIFWNGSVQSVSEIAKADDRDFLQVVDGVGNIGFSRVISSVGKAYILDHYKEYGGLKPPLISHQGINDTFIEKGSTVLYLHRGKWLKLQGAD